MTRRWELKTKWTIFSGNLLVLILVLWIGTYAGLRSKNPWSDFFDSDVDYVVETPHWMPFQVAETFRSLIPLDFSITGKRTLIVTEKRFHIGATAEF